MASQKASSNVPQDYTFGALEVTLKVTAECRFETWVSPNQKTRPFFQPETRVCSHQKPEFSGLEIDQLDDVSLGDARVL